MSYAVRKDGQGWRAVNGPSDVESDEDFSEVQPQLVASPAQIQAQISADVQRRLDEWAQQREYDGIASLVTYAGDADQTLNAEGTLGKNKRSETWVAMKNIRAEVLAGTRPMPTSIADIEADLPVLVWPS